jgi:hypothetical protein
MSENKRIKIVKRAERNHRNAASAKSARDAAHKAATDMVATVTNWVSELQQRQRDETNKAIDNLIRARQQPNQA